jgi:flagellin
MSFRINTNLNALSALQNLSSVGDQFSTSINRLSTGLRINSAADDPAGFIISQNFKAQLSGIDQALHNNQDAVNFSKTAEGALSEVNSLLNDARTLAVAAGNTGTLDANSIQANQSQLNSIIASIDRIAGTTTFGNKHLLDGSAGVVATNANGADFSALQFSGQFNGKAITSASAVTVVVTSAASKASVASKTFAFGTTTLTAGSFSINGTTFNTTASDTVNSIVQKINASQGQTGVAATYTTGGAITLTQVSYGAGNSVNLSDANAVLLAAAGSSTAAGTDAVATATINNGGLVTVNFTGGKYGQSALKLTDSDGNAITLTEAGNATNTAQLAGQLSVGSANFQIGGNANQTTSLSLGNFASTQLGAGAVSGLTVSNLDLTTATGATNALKVIDQAISDVSKSRGDIGNFQRNIIQSNIRSLGVAKQNISASLSSITDVDVAEEMTNFTKLQILQQSGVSVLAQANSQPSAVLKLLG